MTTLFVITAWLVLGLGTTYLVGRICKEMANDDTSPR